MYNDDAGNPGLKRIFIGYVFLVEFTMYGLLGIGYSCTLPLTDVMCWLQLFAQVLFLSH